MNIVKSMKDAYGFYVGTISKVVYPLSISTSAASHVFSKATAFNFLISIPIRFSTAYYTKHGFLKKTQILFNINSEFDNIKTIATISAIATTFFDTEQRTKHRICHVY